ncbi:ABC transporter permease [Nocardioides lijunqiniae]|uniref:ABC transporter permease n=1 Tax=Nocardioides lijunqiniae TaxID=2760832 RepID=UPI001877768B|nr:hypothetical protein [Nocardioides lijunqiniae]
MNDRAIASSVTSPPVTERSAPWPTSQAGRGWAAVVGVGNLLRLAVRKDRLRLPLWLGGLGGTIAASALAVPRVYDTPSKVAGYVTAVGVNPVTHLMSGRQAGLDTLGGIVANEISQVAQLGICLMVMFLVVRHTRAEEESGRAELVRSAAVGRHAATMAGLTYAVGAAAIIGAVTTASMLAGGLALFGSLTYGAGLTLLGITYAAATLVAVQVAASARGALGLAGAAVAIGYSVRGVGAMQDNALVWMSPFGWAQRMDAFGDERWWPALLLLAAAALLVAVAARVTTVRDFGTGLLATRPGRPRAGRMLGNSVGLAVRAQRGLITGWAIGLILLGLIYGAILPTIPDLVASNPEIADAVGASGDAEDALTDAFLAYIFVFMATISCGFVVASAMRLRAEEASGRTEAVLATAVTRSAWMSASTAVAFLAVTTITVLMGSGLAVGSAVATGDWTQALSQVGGQLAYLPGTLVVGGATFALYGLLPRGIDLAWALVAFVALQQMLGQLLALPEVVDAMSPFSHLAEVPNEAFASVPFTGLLALAAALSLAGLWGYRRRDTVAS